MSHQIGRPKEKLHPFMLTANVEQETNKGIMEIARREGKSKSSLIDEILKDYIKAHRHGNSQYTLTALVENPEVKAYPTPWKRLGRDDLKPYSSKELHEMEIALTKNLETIRFIQREPVAFKSTKAPR